MSERREWRVCDYDGKRVRQSWPMRNLGIAKASLKWMRNTDAYPNARIESRVCSPWIASTEGGEEQAQ